MKATFILAALVLAQQAVSADAEHRYVLSLGASSDSRFQVLTKDSSSKARIEREANEVLKRVQAELGASTTGPPSPPITIEVHPGVEEASGSTRYVPVGGNRIQNIRIELKGSIEGIVKDVLPREISHIVFAEQIGVPPRWADFGVGFLAESEPRRDERWTIFRHARDAGSLIPTGEMLTLDKLEKFPKEADEMRLLYAQSMTLVQYIVQHWGFSTFVALAGDAKRMTPEEALQEHLGFESVGEFDLAFRQWATTK